jgi:hypothetical protein
VHDAGPALQYGGRVEAPTPAGTERGGGGERVGDGNQA